MPIYKPSELKALLEQLGAHPKKRFSQNFLIDGNVIRKIADLAAIHAGDEVVEIGPGPGALTEELLSRGARLLAIEKDTLWADALRRLPGDITVIEGDILKCPLEKLVSEWKRGKKVKVVANLPYHITTPILTTLAPQNTLFSELFVMVQEEVASRYTSPPGSKEYGSITLFLNYWADVKYGFKVKNTSFYPSPKVASAFIHLRLRPPPYVSDEERFFQMTRCAFNQRRKMLRSSLKEYLAHSSHASERKGEVKESLSYLGEKRPEELSLKEFIALFENL